MRSGRAIDECEILCRHLIGRPPPETVRARYDEGSDRLFSDPAAPGALAFAFALEHPWALGPLDACAALWAPASLVRRKLLFVLALLETTPELAGWFEARAQPFSLAVLELAALGACFALSLAVGLVLWPLVSLRR